ncbi:MAG TPA: STAS domain-containing protein [Chthoniobacteraceae bacterium]|nr:STAS domain-containing protein [Chthoniobacteraceae bacterium]
MQITQRLAAGPILVLSVAGRLDNVGSDQFREQAMEQIRSGVRAVIVDFCETTYVASMGIRALFIPAQELAKHKGRMVLTGLSRDIRSLFVTAGLMDLFDVFDSVESAMADPGWGPLLKKPGERLFP